jgi:hypothetical protein
MRILYRVKEERDIIHIVKRRKINLIDHMLRRNCLLKYAIEGQRRGGRGEIEVTGRQRRRRKQLLDDRKKRTESGNWRRKH